MNGQPEDCGFQIMNLVTKRIMTLRTFYPATEVQIVLVKRRWSALGGRPVAVMPEKEMKIRS